MLPLDNTNISVACLNGQLIKKIQFSFLLFLSHPRNALLTRRPTKAHVPRGTLSVKFGIYVRQMTIFRGY
jgi:hypothetical protein